ncbi:hypothetical protein [Pseudomonas hunanensis]|uniref:hypothetical protein n=1 Tax=Pseudomonas hunanensis TaxID=1247546 RepID=UPI002404AA59|nr:hypothetical protein [Pseudomonas hunanensis]MDF9756784.1 hypothetical protein [Pseudomonas hunanensis]
MPKVIVTFDKNWRGYAAGETAGFDTSVAEALIEGGYAAESGDKPAAAKPPGSGKAVPEKKEPAAPKGKSPAKPTAKSGPADTPPANGNPVVEEPKP